MIRRRRLVILMAVILVGACALPGESPTLPPSSIPSPSASVALTSTPSETPSSPLPSPIPATPSPTPATTQAPSAAPTSGETMTVRAYLFLADTASAGPFLVPVLRNVPRSVAAATSAMLALLAGPSATELAADPKISTTIPAGTELLGITIKNGLATVDLSDAFASGGGSFSVEGRLAQVVYTLTQFATVDRVRFELGGVPVTVFSSEGIVLDQPVTRVTYRDEFLPPIFVDRPAWGASLANPGRVRGLADVFEAQFLIALLDGNGRSLVARPVKASCGTGCWGTFDVTLSYDVAKTQWGTLRVWDPSEKDGSAQAVREYPVYLHPAP